FFFFSSRRRHTRSDRDWSSDVCSSDLLLTLAAFVFLYHVESGNVVLMLGLLLWVGAPALYLTKFRLFTRPVTESPDLEALARTQLLVLGAVAGGVLLVAAYLFTAKVGGATI